MPTFVDHYATLGIRFDASDDDIREAYRKASFRWHPDRNQHRVAEAHTRFLEVGAAFATLGDPSARRLYDLQWQTHRGLPPQRPHSPTGEAIRRAEAATTKKTPVRSWATAGHPPTNRSASRSSFGHPTSNASGNRAFGRPTSGHSHSGRASSTPRPMVLRLAALTFTTLALAAYLFATEYLRSIHGRPPGLGTWAIRLLPTLVVLYLLVTMLAPRRRITR